MNISSNPSIRLADNEMSAVLQHTGTTEIIGINHNRLVTERDNGGYERLHQGFDSLSARGFATLTKAGEKQHFTNLMPDLQEYSAVVAYPAAVVITQINDRIADSTASFTHYWGIEKPTVMELVPRADDYLIARLQDNAVWKLRVQEACQFPDIHVTHNDTEFALSIQDIPKIEAGQTASTTLPSNLTHIIQNASMSCTFSCVDRPSNERTNYAIMWTEDEHCVFVQARDNTILVSQKSIAATLDKLLSCVGNYINNNHNTQTNPVE